MLTRANQLEIAVHGCRILLILGLVSIMSLSDQPCRNLSHLYFWLIRSFTDPKYTCNIFVVLSIAYCLVLTTLVEPKRTVQRRIRDFSKSKAIDGH